MTPSLLADPPLIRLVASEEPSVVFASMGAQCVPELCDECTIDIVDGVHARYRLAYPPRLSNAGGFARLNERAAVSTAHLVSVNFEHTPPVTSHNGFEGDETGRLEPFHGLVTFVWKRRIAAHADRRMARLLVEHAVRTVEWQRSERNARAATSNAARLRMAVDTNRQIGTAVGILMSLHKITRDQAFDLLRIASGRLNRKLREIALDVIETGCLDPELIIRTRPRSRPLARVRSEVAIRAQDET